MQLSCRAVALKIKDAARENTCAWCALSELQQRERDNAAQASGAAPAVMRRVAKLISDSTGRILPCSR